MSSEVDRALGAVPESLVGLVVETAHSVLRALEPAEVSVAARPLLRFDRRGLASAAARRQVIAALRREPELRAKVAEAILERDEVAATLAAYDGDDPVASTERAADRDDLGLLVAALWAGAPDGAAFGIGVCVSTVAARRERDLAAAETAAVQNQLEAERIAFDRMAQRADDGEHAAAKATEQLRDERAGRRQREQTMAAEVAAAERALGVAEATLAEERTRVLALENQRTRDQARIAELELALRTARDEFANLQRSIAAPVVAPDELEQLAQLAEQVRARIAAVSARVAAAPVAPAGTVVRSPQTAVVKETTRPAAPTRRTRPNLPGGLVADTGEGSAAMFSRTADLVLVVDGYNVSKRAWPESPLSDQREKLVRGLQQVHLRYGCEVVVCFDGDGTEGVRPLRRTGMRVVFSARGQEADELVVEAVESLPKRVPVVVASSDAWVREHAERAGATVISAPTALELARLAGRR